MHDAHLYAILPAADGQPAAVTTHSVVYQAAVDGAADVLNTWLGNPNEQNLLELMHERLDRTPGSAREPFAMPSCCACSSAFAPTIRHRLLAL
ncbi:hypothetical protein OMD46_10620 [Pseudomonas sp. MDMC_285]|nr:hypothetical protein [Pseudomonas sp. MDMC_285]